MEKIIEIIRGMSGWVANHSSMKFGNESIAYYDTSQDSDYFTLKHNGVGVTHMNSERCTIEFWGWEKIDAFSFDKWLSEIEEIVKQNILMIGGKEYLLTEVKK